MEHIGKVCWHSTSKTGKGFLEEVNTKQGYEFFYKDQLKRGDEVLFELNEDKETVKVKEKIKKFR